jgi:hypothetical protein
MSDDQAKAILEIIEQMDSSIQQQLYDSEINFEVACVWDGGFIVKLGDALNGYKAEANLETWDDVETWLSEQAALHFPDSKFAGER